MRIKAHRIGSAGFDLGQVARGAVIYAIVMAAVLFCGGLRLALHPPAGETVKAALGDYFPWLCMLGLIGMFVTGIVRTVAQVRSVSTLLRIAGRIRGCSILSLKKE